MSSAILRFLADESCDFAVVRRLRADGHDVVAICEVAPRTADADVMERALRERRVLLTEDKDFGWLVHVSSDDRPGVVLLRYPARARAGLAQHVSEVARDLGAALDGAFTVMQPGQVRVVPRAGADEQRA